MGTVMAMQMQLWTSTGEDIRCAEHQNGLFLPTCFVHYVSVGHFLVYMSSERRSIQTVEKQEEIGSMEPDYQHISQYICTQLMTHINWNFVVFYPITENYCRTFYLQMRTHLLVTVLLIPATVIIGRRITLMLPFIKISKHGSP